MEQPNPALALKAEMVFAWHLVTRHRAPRLALLLVGALAALLKAEPGPESELVSRHSLVLMGGILSSVASSRLMSRGAALGSIRQVASSPWIPPAGRVCGALLFAILPIVVASKAFHTEALTPLATLLFMAALGSLVMALAPCVGASAAAAIGLLLSLAGAFQPSWLVVALDRWPRLAGILTAVWRSLPLPWRVPHWLVSRDADDLFLLGTWTVLGILGSAWIATRTPRSFHRISDP